MRVQASETGDSAQRAKRAGDGWRRLWLLLAVGLVMWVVLEVGLALAGAYPPVPYTYVGDHPNRPSKHFAADERVGWTMHPSSNFSWSTEGRRVSYHADENGFRTSGVAEAEFSEGSRLVVAGDSYMWGLGVEYAASVPGLLEQELGGRVVNLAQPGYGLDQVMLSLRHFAPSLEPDLIVVGVFDDDFRRSLNAFRESEGFNKPTFRLEGGELVRKQPEDRPGALGSFVERHSRVFGLLRRSDWKLRGTGWSGGVVELEPGDPGRDALDRQRARLPDPLSLRAVAGLAGLSRARQIYGRNRIDLGRSGFPKRDASRRPLFPD